MKQSAERLLIGGIAIVTFFLLILAVLSYRQTLKVDGVTSGINHSSEILTQLTHLYVAVVEHATSTRRYALSSAQEEVEGIQLTASGVMAELDTLGSLIRENKVHAALFDSTAIYIRKRIEHSFRIIKVGQGIGPQAAAELYETGYGRDYNIKILMFLYQMQSVELMILGEESGKSARGFRILNHYHLAILPVILALILFLFQKNRWDFKERKKTELFLRNFNTELEKRLEKQTGEIRKSEERYRSMVENATEALFVMDFQLGKFVSVSQSACRLFKMSKEELLSVGPLQLSPEYQPDGCRSADKVPEYLHQAIRGGKTSFEWIHMDAEGTKIPCEIWLVRLPDQDKVLLRGSVIDISERKKTDTEKEKIRYDLNERVKELTALYHTSQILHDEEHSIDVVMKEVLQVAVSGWQYSDITAARLKIGHREIRTKNYAPGVHQQVARFIAPDGSEGELEVTYLEKRPAEYEDAFLKEERHLIDMLADMIRTFLVRRHEVEALKKSEANLQTIFENTDNVYVLLDLDFRVKSFNQRAAHLHRQELGVEIAEGDYILTYMPEERSVDVKRLFRKALKGKMVNYETSYLLKNGSFRWYNIKIIPITNTSLEILGLMVAFNDVTEKRQMERRILDQKVQEQKKIIRAVLNAEERERNKIGQELHDNVNQILAGTKMYLSRAWESDLLRKDLITSSIVSIDMVIEEIRLLSSSQVTPPKENTLDEQVRVLLDKLPKHKIEKTTLHCQLGNYSINGDLRLNIYRIVQEQINNITKHACATEVIICMKIEDEFLHLSIKDNGKGFNPKMKRKGIGISNMINRVESFNGSLEIDSGPGLGCTIGIRIPLT